MDFDAQRFQQELRTEALGRFMLYRPATETTMRLARREADEGGPHGTLILAEEQTAGQARHGRPFYSPPGGNVYLTALLRGEGLDRTSLALAVPVAIARACRAYGVDARIKWPDDIWAGERKLGATYIALQTGDGPATALVGIGLNVNGDPASENEELATVATSMRTETGNAVDREQFLAQLCNELEGALAEPADSISDAYHADSMTIGQRVAIRDSAGVRVGEATGINRDGTLVVAYEQGETETVVASDVFVLRREEMPS